MRMEDIRQTATLNRTFAALVAQEGEERRSRLILNTNVSRPVLKDQLLSGDWKAVASDIVKRLQRCMYVADVNC